MKKDTIRLAAIFATAIIFLTSAIVWSVSPKNDYSGIPYEKAMQDNKPFIMLFYADWCTSCKRFIPIFNMLKNDYKNKFNFVTLNGDDAKYRNIIMDYRIGSFPSLYIVDPMVDNRVFINGTFYGNPEVLEKELDRFLKVRERMFNCKAE